VFAASLLALSLVAAPVAVDEVPAGRIVEKLACRSNPAFSYALYLPSGYTPERRWPVLLVFDPGARATYGAELFRASAERFGWIVMSSADTRSSGVTMRHNVDAAIAMLGDADTRWATDRTRYYATGFSGGATLAWMVGREGGHFAGVIGCGGPWQDGVFPEHATYDHFGAAGMLDFNHVDMIRIDRLLGERGAAHRIEFFPGPHAWMPAPLAAEALAWLEVQAMQRGLRGRDEALLATLYAADYERGRELEAQGLALDAMRRWQAAAATFDGLVDVAAARAEATRLAASSAVADALAAETKWRAFEDGCLASMRPVLAALLRGDPPAAPVLARDLRVAEFERMAERPGIEGTIGRRLLESAWSQLAVALAPQLLERQDYARLVPVLTVAVRVRPDAPSAQYNLACALARTGSPGAALDALARAVDAGFRDRGLIERDPDLRSLRKRKEFAEIVSRIPASPAPPPAATPAAPPGAT
jgi:dienelactone hydrolase